MQSKSTVAITGAVATSIGKSASQAQQEFGFNRFCTSTCGDNHLAPVRRGAALRVDFSSQFRGLDFRFKSLTDKDLCSADRHFRADKPGNLAFWRLGAAG